MFARGGGVAEDGGSGLSDAVHLHGGPAADSGFSGSRVGELYAGDSVCHRVLGARERCFSGPRRGRGFVGPGFRAGGGPGIAALAVDVAGRDVEESVDESGGAVGSGGGVFSGGSEGAGGHSVF